MSSETNFDKFATFDLYAKFEDGAREYAAMFLKGKSYNDIFEMLKREHAAANDNRSAVGDQAVNILMSHQFMNMNVCWLLCHRDLVMTRLTYDPDVTYTLEA